MDDRELLLQYRNERCETALRALVERHTPMVYSACLRRLSGDRGRAEEATQSVFTALALHPEKVGRPEALSGWLHRLSEFVVSHMKRDEQRRRHHEQIAAEKRLAMENESQSWKEVWPQIDSCIDKLPEKQRSVVVLYYLEGMKEAEIAGQCGISESSVRNHLNSALERLKTRLNATGLTLSAAALGKLISDNAVQAVPESLAHAAGTAAYAAASGSAGAATPTILNAKGSLKMMTWMNVKVACLWIALALVGLTTLAVQLVGAEDKPRTIARPAPVLPETKGDKSDESAPKKPDVKKKAGPTFSLEARVVTVDGKPVPGVKVTFSSHKFDPKKGNGESREFTWAAVSDEKGIARVDAPADEVDVGASCRVETGAGGALAPCSISMPQPAFAQSNYSRTAEILLAPAQASIGGLVSGDDGKPIGGVKIALSLAGNYGTYSREAITDDSGRYQIAGLAAGQYNIGSVVPPEGSPWIRLSGWKMRYNISVGEGKTATQDFQLTRGARLKGRVFDDKGKPIAGARVSCSMDSATEVGPKSMYQMPGQWYSAEALTDNDGRYVLGAITQETYRIRVAPPKDSVLAWATVCGINAMKGEDAAMQDIVLVKGATIMGTICGADGKAIAGAEAEILGVDSGHHKTISDEKGRFIVKGLPTGTYKVAASPPDESELLTAQIDGVAAIRSFSVEQRLELPLGATVNATIKDPDGKPLSGAKIYLNYNPPDAKQYGSINVASGITDEGGRLSLRGIGIPPQRKPGGTWQMHVGAPPNALLLKGTSVNVEGVAPGKTVEASATLTAGEAAITGIVKTPDGKALPGCRMAVVRINGPGSCTGTQYAVNLTDAEGRFAIGQIEPDNWAITVEPPEGSEFAPSIEAVRHFAAGSIDVEVKAQKGAVVFGKILTSKGEPVVGALVAAQNTGRDRQWIPSIKENTHESSRTKADGTFKICGLRAGTLKISCAPLNPEFRATELVMAVPAGGDVEAILNAFPVSAVHGRVTSAKPLPENCYIEFVPEVKGEEMHARSNVDRNGQFKAEYRLSPGKYTVKLSYWGNRKQETLTVSAPKEVIVKEGEDLDLQVTAEQ